MSEKKGLELLAEIIGEEIQKENEAMEAGTVEVPEDLHNEMLAFVRELDRKDAERRKKQLYARVMRIAAVFCVCFITMGTLALGTSDAFRERIFTLFQNKEEGSVTLRNESEYELIGNWTDYWYPTWMPEGYYLLGADKQAGVMLYVSDSENVEIRIIENDLNTSQTFDTDTTAAAAIEVQGYEGYLFVDEKNKSVDFVWMTESRQIHINQKNSADASIVRKVADNMKYIPEH